MSMDNFNVQEQCQCSRTMTMIKDNVIIHSIFFHCVCSDDEDDDEDDKDDDDNDDDDDNKDEDDNNNDQLGQKWII